MRFTPSSADEIQQMLDYLGKNNLDDLFSSIPKDLILKKGLDLPKPMNEVQLKNHFYCISKKNKKPISFVGGGIYNHFIPSAVSHITGRSEFYTSYTPYQAEISQGILQVLFEFQSMVCELTEKDVSNATMYDGSTSLCEAVTMAKNIKRKKKVIVSDSVHPHYLQVLKTYCRVQGIVVEVIESEDGLFSDYDPGDDVCAIVVQSPNYFGLIEDTKQLHEKLVDDGVLLICVICEAASLGLINPPSADIICGDLQSFGISPFFGGPTCGFLSTSMDHLRYIPGRLVGDTVDKQGKHGFVLTLQSREQHIRRERASSNICTSQSLMGLSVAAYLSLIGPRGLEEVAQNSHKNAKYIFGKLSGLDGFEKVFNSPFFNEFTIKCPRDKVEKCVEKDIIAGISLGQHYPKYDGCRVFCSTEMHTREDIEMLLEALL